MSSSDEAADFDLDKSFVNRALFVRLLGENPIVIDKSKVPSVVAAKKKAWDCISQEYSQTTGKPSNPAQLLKSFNNMKTKIKKKTDKNTTGNKKIKLSDWEKDFLTLLHHDENPVFKKVPGSLNVYGNEVEPSVCSNIIDQVNEVQQPISERTENSQKYSKKSTSFLRKGTKRLMEYESDETKEMSTPQIQRAVLLQQMQLQQIQIEREKILLANVKKQFTDAATSTDDLFE